MLLGTVAILGMYALVRAAGGGPWSALGAAALMACDNLLLVHGRIGTLDIYAVAMMIWAAALYLRGRPLLAGVVLASARASRRWRRTLLFALSCSSWAGVARRVRGGPDVASETGAVAARDRAAVTTAAVFIGAARDHGPDRDAVRRRDRQAVTGGPFGHLAHIITYAAQPDEPARTARASPPTRGTG